MEQENNRKNQPWVPYTVRFSTAFFPDMSLTLPKMSLARKTAVWRDDLTFVQQETRWLFLYHVEPVITRRLVCIVENKKLYRRKGKQCERLKVYKLCCEKNLKKDFRIKNAVANSISRRIFLFVFVTSRYSVSVSVKSQSQITSRCILLLYVGSWLYPTSNVVWAHCSKTEGYHVSRREKAYKRHKRSFEQGLSRNDF